MATAAGAAVILYYMFGRRASSKDGVEDDDENDRSGDFSKSTGSARRRFSRRPAQAPATWIESMSTLSDTLRFTYSETLGKWPIGDLAFGINYLMRRQVSKLAQSWSLFSVNSTFLDGSDAKSFGICVWVPEFWLN